MELRQLHHKLEKLHHLYADINQKLPGQSSADRLAAITRNGCENCIIKIYICKPNTKTLKGLSYPINNCRVQVQNVNLHTS